MKGPAPQHADGLPVPNVPDRQAAYEPGAVPIALTFQAGEGAQVCLGCRRTILVSETKAPSASRSAGLRSPLRAVLG